MKKYTPVVDCILQVARQQPSSLAIIQGKRQVTYGELLGSIRSTAAHLLRIGIECGDRILIDGLSTPSFVQVYLAVHLIGGVAIPVDPNSPVSRIINIAERVKPVLAITSSETEKYPCQAITMSQVESWGILNGEKIISCADSNKIADLVFTTGTSGQPKGVCLTHGNISAAAKSINAVIGTESSDTEVIPLPLYHSFGLGRIRCCLSKGATVVLVQGFRLPGEILSAVERYSATGLVGVPTGFSILLQFGKDGLGFYADQLRYVEIGSAPMRSEDKVKLMNCCRNTRIFMHYGLTEASRSCFIEFHRDRNKLSSIGKPSPVASIEIKDDCNEICDINHPGIMWISGEHVAKGYWENSQLTEQSFINGSIRTGDVAHIDADGFLYLHGREDDMINIGGFNVSPVEVEEILKKHPFVSDAACVAFMANGSIDNPILRAFLVGSSEDVAKVESELIQLAKLHLEKYKIPAEFIWVSSLPKTDSGKLLRRMLRD